MNLTDMSTVSEFSLFCGQREISHFPQNSVKFKDFLESMHKFNKFKGL